MGCELIVVGGDRQPRAQGPVTVQAPFDISVGGQAGCVDHCRFPGQSEVEEDARVVRDQDVGRQHELLDTRVPTDIDHPWDTSGPVHVVAAHQDHRIEELSQTRPVQCPHRSQPVRGGAAGSTRRGPQALAPGRGVENDGLSRSDTELVAHPSPYFSASEQPHVAGVLPHPNRPAVSQCLLKAPTGLRALGQQQVPLGDLAVHESPVSQGDGSRRVVQQLLDRSAVPGLEQVLALTLGEPGGEVVVGDDDT